MKIIIIGINKINKIDIAKYIIEHNDELSIVPSFTISTVNSKKSPGLVKLIVSSSLITSILNGYESDFGTHLNNDNEVIGVTFAGVFDNKGEFITGYAIPVVRINEFLSKYI